MITWGDYLGLLTADGVEVGRSELEAIGEDGRRVTATTLVRWVDGRLYYHEVPEITDAGETVPRYVQRQVMNRLRLPPERYAFGRL